jgi:outer membrane protein assembly factor BamB
MLASRPSGATVWRDGSPLTVDRDGGSVPLTTPAVLECARDATDEFELRLNGFESRTVRVSPVPDETSMFVLTAVPDWRFSQDLPILTGPGLGAGYLGVGLRGGKVALAWTRDQRQSSMVIDLPELSEMRGLPVFTSTRVMFRTNDGHLACHLLDDGRRAWLVTPPQALGTDPAAQDGRLFFGDVAGGLTCMTVETGRVLWSRQLDSPLAATPTVAARVLRVATRDGVVSRIDASDGRTIGEPWRYQHGVTTPVLLLGKSTLVFGTGSGDLVARDEDGTVRWTKALGRALRPEELAIAGDCVLVAGSD